MKKVIIVLHNVGLVFRNFSGEARRFNTAGNRNFNAAISEAQAEMLTEKGFKVRVFPPKEDGGDPLYLLKVNVSYKYEEPNAKVVNTRCIRKLNEDTIGELDNLNIDKCDISITPSMWEKANGERGLSAYLSSIYATVVEDPLALEYEQMEMALNGTSEEEPF